MELRQLRHFIALAETLNFHRAAERLHIAQPALSISIRRLEEDLGVPLFERGRGGTVLSAAGAAALPEAIRTLQQAEQLQSRARAGMKGDVGVVHVCFVGSATYALLPKVLAELRSEHPGIRTQLHESTTTAIVTGLIKKRFDIGIVRYPLRSPPDMVMELLDRDSFHVALPPGHRFARRRHIALSELANDPFVMAPTESSDAKQNLGLYACQLAGFVPQIAQEATQLQTIVCLVESGVGVALVPSGVIRSIQSRVTIRPLSDIADRLPMGLALLYPKGGLRPAVAQFRDIAKKASSH
ncbi:LysR substrate-binding domain-containing protein [Hydrogenophaga sp. 2FB]|uniref:LysR family transcriptional regulator n=1 Tax=Hydrogenophaga sp. 2FB TaxID=2502187 RepID=UPI001484DD33|nr:LysR substrate-binding domain-containing protein [Hydrogenophaga sp. 2FB]